ncbi:MAG: hypothetical protein GXO73_00150, partial [Calditrichaeota bacterium]|nr:hypothetical protein [Calditrichota bacterium]
MTMVRKPASRRKNSPANKVQPAGNQRRQQDKAAEMRSYQDYRRLCELESWKQEREDEFASEREGLERTRLADEDRALQRKRDMEAEYNQLREDLVNRRTELQKEQGAFEEMRLELTTTLDAQERQQRSNDRIKESLDRRHNTLVQKEHELRCE